MEGRRKKKKRVGAASLSFSFWGWCINLIELIKQFSFCSYCFHTARKKCYNCGEKEREKKKIKKVFSPQSSLYPFGPFQSKIQKPLNRKRNLERERERRAPELNVWNWNYVYIFCGSITHVCHKQTY